MEKIGGKKGLLAKKRIICESRKFAWKESTFSSSSAPFGGLFVLSSSPSFSCRKASVAVILGLRGKIDFFFGGFHLNKMNSFKRGMLPLLPLVAE